MSVQTKDHVFIAREMMSKVTQLAQAYPVVAVLGPRQSGKTTLVKEVFSDYRYVTLERGDTRSEAMEDPRRFLLEYSDGQGLIIDEAQVVPELFSYMQGIVDEMRRPGQFILTGSQNFLLYEKITQSLAGRIALLTLLPLSIDELKQAGRLPGALNEVLFTGCYPRVYDSHLDPHEWAANYVKTYIERDARQVINLVDVHTFEKFIRLCAARVGNLISYAELARDADISPLTAKKWLSVLETSYIIRFLQPYHRNFNKRMIKSPKLYFYDTGLVCYLLGIDNARSLSFHPQRGALVEMLVMNELSKYRYNVGRDPQLYFWRDVQGHEVDVIIERVFDQPIPLEVKSGTTINQDYFKGLNSWREITGQSESDPAYLVYAGDDDQVRKQANIVRWDHIKKIVDGIYGELQR